MLQCQKIKGSLWNYYRDEPSDTISSDSESFKYKTSITRKIIILVLVKLVMMEIKLVKMKLKLLFD